LFTGDAEEAEENDLLSWGNELKSDVYQAGHHGSSDASSASFLGKVQPSFTVISCGIDNDYGHPHKKTLQRFLAAESQILRTDLSGTIRFRSDGTNLSYEAEW
ncbi:MAG: MBL fold metallo-hydrolase, partial [Lachnospiraceae bacterium]|nr:MBL fold metallo-hydrolase [Lachnospiraceae bacterium]